jgi:probable rRNA maturation factor
MTEIVYNKQAGCPWTKKAVERLLAVIGKKVKLKGGLEVNIIGASAMRRLNRQTRGKDKVTDVLSFAWQEDKILKSNFLGQIYICYPRIVSQAKSFAVPVKEEFIRIFTHGILHLAGYDHIKKKDAQRMFVLQEQIVNQI